jgi:YD repeat-containing protein
VNRITQVQNPQGDRTSYSYDDAGRRTLKKMSNGTRASFSYDAAGNLTKLYNLKSDGSVISSFDYSYDKVGNRTAVLEADGSRVTWSYDATYQLTGEHRTGTSAYRDTYSYDPTGNRLLKIHDGARTTSAYDAANQLRYTEDVSGRTTYTFDADGNQQRILAPNGDRTTYVWDYENRMTRVELPSGIRNTMAYEPEGLRVKLEESTGVKKFVWDEQNYLAETDSANDTQVVYTNEPRRYGNLVSQRRLTSGVWTPHWYHFDAIGSTRELTTSGQVVSDTRLYDAWGIIVAQSGANVTPFAFSVPMSLYMDVDSPVAYLHWNYYRPSIGRLLLLQAPVGTFAYVFAANAPTDTDDAVLLETSDGEVPGTFNVQITPCDPGAVKRFPGCCCTQYWVRYKPTDIEAQAYSRICLQTSVRTEMILAKCRDTIDDWHPDKPKDPQACWSKPPRFGDSANSAYWSDFPGGGPTKGCHVMNIPWYGGCPWFCAPVKIKQDWEVCAVGTKRIGGGESVIGCVSYGHQCDFTYTSDWYFGLYGPECCCDVSCTHTRTPDKTQQDVAPKPPAHRAR